MDLKNSDACDGRARQVDALMFILISPVVAFFLLREIINLGFYFSFGAIPGPWIDSLIILGIGALMASFHTHFWVNVDGNRIQPAIDVLFPKKLRDGSTRFIVYTSGFALKLPWISRQGDPIEIEKRRTKPTDEFTVTVSSTSLILQFKIAWKPHIHFLSTYLQNAITEEGEGSILNQIIAHAKMLMEEECSRGGVPEVGDTPDPEYVRKNQSTVIEKIFDDVFDFAEHFGVEILNISFSKCDYSYSVQKQKDRVRESESIAVIRDALIAAGVEPGQAARLAAVQSHVPGVTISDQNFGGLEGITQVLATALGGKTK